MDSTNLGQPAVQPPPPDILEPPRDSRPEIRFEVQSEMPATRWLCRPRPLTQQDAGDCTR